MGYGTMIMKDFMTLKTFEENDFTGLYTGELFLHGDYMIAQKGEKKMGDQISYYRVIKTDGVNIEYTTVFDVMEDE